MSSFKGLLLFLSLMLLTSSTATAATKVGEDLIQAFASAHAGAPLRAAVLGGSITQAGGGWIGPWLRAQFPRSLTTLANAGMSATGSELGVFRLERDVLSLQPDVVFLETTVNDAGGNDADVMRSVESLVVRLKMQAPPPAVVFIHSASANTLDKSRHSAVARHYGLLEIDLDVALKAHLKREQKSWAEFMSDDVHPNAAGNAFYAQALAAALQPFVTSTRDVKASSQKTRLPKPLSRLPLWLDGQMVPLRELAQPENGWNGQSTLVDTRTGAPQWWGQFFNGILSTDAPGATLEIPFRGSAVGLLYALQPGFGSFYASIDGRMPRLINTGVRDGYESTILAQDLAPGEHRLTLVLPPAANAKTAPVNLGALLLAGASETKMAAAPAQLGPYSAARLRALKFVPLMPAQWRWAGPFGTGEAPAAGGVSTDFETRFAPETKADVVDWQAVGEGQSQGEVINFVLSNQKPRGVFYAGTTLRSARDSNVLLQLTLDYYAKVWVNGREVVTIRETHGHPRSPLLFPVSLRAGENHIMVKLHPGSGGADFSLAVAELPQP